MAGYIIYNITYEITFEKIKDKINIVKDFVFLIDCLGELYCLVYLTTDGISGGCLLRCVIRQADFL